MSDEAKKAGMERAGEVYSPSDPSFMRKEVPGCPAEKVSFEHPVAQPAGAEPVARLDQQPSGLFHIVILDRNRCSDDMLLYTHPAPSVSPSPVSVEAAPVASVAGSRLFAWLVRASKCGIPAIESAAQVMKDYYEGVGPEDEYDSRATLPPQPLATQAVPEGYKLVPIEPTEAMHEAYNNVPCGFGGSPAHSFHVWEAMLAAAPEAPHPSAVSASVPEQAEAASWKAITAPGQVKVGDKLRFTIGDKKYSQRAKLILHAGSDKEEIIYNRRQNYYLITSMAMANKGSQKDVQFLATPSDHSADKQAEGE